MIHIDAKRGGHAWQVDLVRRLLQKLSEIAIEQNENFENFLRDSYTNLAQSIRKTPFSLPFLEEVVDRVTHALQNGEIGIKEVNSESQVIDLLDDNGQLRLDNPFNIFIGGQVLDRGINVDNMIGFFYGRNPSRFQMDTVLQHSRMYGNRSHDDLAVTRFYTSPRIYDAMRSMHFCDEALREAIQTNGQARVRFLARGTNGEVRPCGPSKIRLSNLKTIRAHAMEKPVGIQTKSKTTIAKIVREIDNKLNLKTRTNNDNPFLIGLEECLQLIDLVNSTFEFSNRENYKNEDWKWDVVGFKESLKYSSGFSSDESLKNKVYVLLRFERNQSRMKDNDLTFNDAPYDGRTDVPTARKYATEIPVLMMLRQEGHEEKGWLGSPFYWPVLMYSSNVPMSIYSEAE